ncbi:MAG: ABC transporter substrate-binding protein, partial [Acidimicrobiales bacterium]
LRHQGKSRRWFVATIVMTALFVASCTADGSSSTTTEGGTSATTDGASGGGETTTTSGGSGERVLRIAVAEAPDPFDPGVLSDNRTIELAQNVFDGMTRISEEDFSIVGGIASEWTVSDDGLVYTFKLRDGVKFHDGTPVTAETVVYSLNRAASPDLASGYSFFLASIDGFDSVSDGSADVLAGVEAIDDLTVQVTLSFPAGYFTSLVALWPYWLVDENNISADGDDWTDAGNLNGTGAFRFVEQVAESVYTFEANPDYYLGAPGGVDKVEVTIVPEPATALARYEAGEFDVIRDLSAATYRQVLQDAELTAQLGVVPLMRTTWINMRSDVAPFDEIGVREAFNLAVDRPTIVEVALGGLGQPASTFLPPGVPASLAGERAEIQLNVEKAKQLLSDAGYPNGEGFPDTSLFYNAREDFQKVAELVQGQLQQNLGISITLEPTPDRSYNELLNDPERRPTFSIYTFGLDYPDPQEQHEYLGKSQPSGFANYGNYSNAEFDDLIDTANATVGFDERMELHRKAENIFLDDWAIIPLYHPLATWLAKPNVEGFEVTSLYMTRWENVSIR